MSGRRNRRLKSPRAAAAICVDQVVNGGRSLTDAMPAITFDDHRDMALAREIATGTLRHYWRLEWIAGQHLERPLKARDSDIQQLLLTGLYQLRETRIKGHAAVSATVDVTRELGKDWARGLINAVLRAELREAAAEPAAASDPAAFFNHPQWMIDLLENDWPDQMHTIVNAANARAPMVLRINSAKTDLHTQCRKLDEAGIRWRTRDDFADAIALVTPVTVDQLPGFAEGAVSVQDLSAQRVADLMELAPGHRVLDACAAPGGKTAHMLERCPALEHVLALDSDPSRLERVNDTLQRIGADQPWTSQVADARQPSKWWDGVPFDRILIDAPCSGSGVISRHPDIKHLRRLSDIEAYAKDQVSILRALWPTLNPGGRLVYATCSIFKQENANSIDEFVRHVPDAIPVDPGGICGVQSGHGRQRLPGCHPGDGFFYAVLAKTDNQDDAPGPVSVT